MAAEQSDEKKLIVNNVQDLIGVVEKLQRIFGVSSPGDIWYRGQGSETWTLVPRLLREIGAQYEWAMLEKFRLGARTRHARCPETDEDVNWFSLMQHYGLPTRFLDWTESILVAAYFAVSDPKASGSAAVWALVPSHLNKSQKLGGGIYHLRHPETMELLGSVIRRTPQDLTMAIAAPEVDTRMMVQQSVFTVHGCDRPLEKMDLADRFVVKMTIPEASRAATREMLAVLGMRRASLFPDLGNLAGELADTYRAIAKKQRGQTTQQP